MIKGARPLWLAGLMALTVAFGVPSQAKAQKGLPEVTIVTAVPNLAFSALWVAEQLNYFEQEGVTAKVSVVSGGSVCQTAVVGRSANFCASSSEGLILTYQEGAPLIAIQAHNRNVTMSVAVRKSIADKFGVSRDSPIDARIKVLTQLGPIGATSPGSASEQVVKFLVSKLGPHAADKLKFVYLGGTELPSSLINGVVDAFALSPPSGESTEPGGKGYVLIPLGRGEVPELTEYPFEVLMVRPDFAEKEPKIARAVARAISRGGALFHSNPASAKAALRAHRLFNPKRLSDDVFDLSYNMVVNAMPRWGNMSSEGWQKVIKFAVAAKMVKDPAKTPSAAEGVLWTNKFVGKAP
ncbi:MAG: ABC transporter substrate-binding protein [Deltaproteobacteria bacterium]|nr:ABC transporter substrate-binding protein [Deltaproteobacteria bacterium]